MPQMAALPPPQPLIAPSDSMADARIADRKRQLEAEFKRALLIAIEANKTYPQRARRRRHEGRVLVAFTVLKDGQIKELRVKQASGYATLDEAALAAIKHSLPFHPIPVALGRPQWEFIVPIEFRLM